MALAGAIGHVRLHVQAQPAQRQRQDGQPGEAVGIEVAEHHDRSSCPDGSRDTLAHHGRIRQQQGVVQAGPRLVEAGGQLGDIDRSPA